MKRIITLAGTLCVLAFLQPGFAQSLPSCVSNASDSDGDGFGFENNRSCIVNATTTITTGTTPTSQTLPTCLSNVTDPDSDGFGFENGRSCLVNATTSTPTSQTLPTCLSNATDPDGDGFGFENNRSCIVDATTTPTTTTPTNQTLASCLSDATDPDGDGFGFENGASCVVDSISTTVPTTDQLPSPVQAVLDITAIKTFRFSWEDVALATSYRLLENADGISGFTQVGEDIQPGVETVDLIVALYNRTNANYVIQSCNAAGCVDSDPLFVSGTLTEAIGYFKASNTGGGGNGFGGSVSLSNVSLSADGATLAVGAIAEGSIATGINGDQADNSAPGAGAVYVFTRSGSLWEQQAYIKASNTGGGELFGTSVSLSADGNTLAVGASSEDSIATGINGDQNNSTASQAGAVYVFTRNGSLWEQQAYVKASNTDRFDFFGRYLSLSADGNTLAVGATGEDSSATGINGKQAGNSAGEAGAVYVFTRSGFLWEQQAYIKAANTSEFDFFGHHLSLSADGNTLAVVASGEDSSATGINGDQTNNSSQEAGAVYVFTRSGSLWEQQAYVKASNTNSFDFFGDDVSLSADGNTLAVGASSEDSSATGINSDQGNSSVAQSGAVYVFTRSGSLWEQQAYIKASNTGRSDVFGENISLSADGNTLVVGAPGEESSTTGINGDQNDNSASRAGAVYVFTRSGSLWGQRAYVKASNTERIDFFGRNVSLSADGNTLAVGAPGENSRATGINGDQADNSLGIGAGAVYLY